MTAPAVPGTPTKEKPNGCWAVSAARLWVRCYTAGVPATVREERRQELESDLWEQSADARRRGDGDLALQVMLRVILGAPADLAWRAEQGMAGAFVRNAAMAVAGRAAAGFSWTVRRGLPGVTFLLAGGYVLVGLLLLLAIAAGTGDRPPSEQAWGAAFLIGSGALITAGFKLAARRRRLAICLLLAGTVPFGLAFHSTVIVPLASVAAVASTVVRARRRAA